MHAAAFFEGKYSFGFALHLGQGCQLVSQQGQQKRHWTHYCRSSYAAFIRVLTSKIASHVMKARSFNEFVAEMLGSNMAPDEPQGKEQKFFQYRPFTRVLHWGRDFRTCCSYVVQNTLEALGFVVYKTRKDRYARWIKQTLGASLRSTA